MSVNGNRPGEPPRVSVCLASYNGAAHIREQIDSILADLGSYDEVVVVDDASQDGTVTVLEGRADPRVRVMRSRRNVGHVKAFERAIGEATGDIIMLSDQDDVWPAGRTATLTTAGGRGTRTGAAPHPGDGRSWPRQHRRTDARSTSVLGILHGLSQ
jgi:glycosyltransferase involved in cell wall biosynthesis